MNIPSTETRGAGEMHSGASLVVLGMHRSGTSAITGALRLCGAWTGDNTELTSPNAENPHGFWERRDIRRICDRLLRTAEADWWKVAKFEPSFIPHAVLTEQRHEFARVVAALDEHRTWVIKEPRLCLLLPVLRDHITNPFCIHIFRNPLEVARSLQRRNGFGIAGGLALWEAYNRHALSASRDLPRVLVSHESLMLHPVETLDGLLERLDGLGISHLTRPDEDDVKHFISPSLYRCRATEDETREFLAASQRALWDELRSNKVDIRDVSLPDSRVSRQYLFDLESTERSLNHHKDGIDGLTADLRTRDRTIRERDATIKECDATIGTRNATVRELDGTVRKRDATVRELDATVRKRDATVQERDATVRELDATVRKRDTTVRELDATVRKRDATVRERDTTVRELDATVRKRDATVRERDTTVRELDATVRERDATVRERDATVRERDATVRGLDATIRRLEIRTNALIETHEQAIRRRERRMKAEMAERNARIHALVESNSWKVTAPLRSLSRGVGWARQRARRALQVLFWICTGRFSRAATVMRSDISGVVNRTRPDRETRRDPDTDYVSDLIADCRKNDERVAAVTNGPLATAEKPGTTVSVIAWDVAHNPLGRAYLLADALRNEYDVELIGATFPRFGSEIWEPLRTGSRVTIKSFPGSNFPGHFKNMEDVAEQIEGDVILVSKPRLPGLELAILAKMHRNRPIIVDVDDYELGFFGNRRPLQLDTIKAGGRGFDTDCPHDEIWTRYSESLIPLFDQVTVSNRELQKRFGGIVLPHVRDAHDFDPALYPRDEIRACLGFSPQDRVIVFAGTPRAHKGYERIVAALEKLNRRDYKFLLVGSPVDRDSRRFLGNIADDNIKTLPNVPFRDLPGYLCAGDLICLLQDEDNPVSRFQMPAKFTDGLAMGIPMLATNLPPLASLANEGLVELLNDMPLDERIDKIFRDYDAHKRAAMRNRQVFLDKYSYGAVVPRCKEMIDRLLRDPAPVPEEFRELVTYHRKIYSDTGGQPRTTLTVAGDAAANQDESPCDAATSHRTVPFRGRKDRSYVDDKLDIVFFWKQNDSGIYGRRQDMLVKYLAMNPRIHRIFHFDAPINFFRSGGIAARTGGMSRNSHARIVLLNTLRRRYFRGRWTKVRRDTFTILVDSRAPGFVKRFLPSEDGYLAYLDGVFRRHAVGERRVVFWVCPNDFHFPSIEKHFRPDLVVADVIDDQRKWDITYKYKNRLHRNYREILSRSDLVFANCQPVLRSMEKFSSNIHLLPNAAEILEHEAESWKKPQELVGMNGPVIGYVGNLDVARIDIDLLVAVATARPDWNLVFIGSMHRGREIRRLDGFRNVHFLGVRVYDKAIQYIKYFDVAIIPHLDNDLTRNMNPLKLYVYFSLHVPVVTTSIANLTGFAELTRIARTPEEFVEQIEHCLDRNPVKENRERLRELVKVNSWGERARRALELIEGEFRNVDGPAMQVSDVTRRQ